MGEMPAEEGTLESSYAQEEYSEVGLTEALSLLWSLLLTTLSHVLAGTLASAKVFVLAKLLMACSTSELSSKQLLLLSNPELEEWLHVDSFLFLHRSFLLMCRSTSKLDTVLTMNSLPLMMRFDFVGR